MTTLTSRIVVALSRLGRLTTPKLVARCATDMPNARHQTWVKLSKMLARGEVRKAGKDRSGRVVWELVI